MKSSFGTGCTGGATCSVIAIMITRRCAEEQWLTLSSFTYQGWMWHLITAYKNKKKAIRQNKTAMHVKLVQNLQTLKRQSCYPSTRDHLQRGSTTFDCIAVSAHWSAVMDVATLLNDMMLLLLLPLLLMVITAEPMQPGVISHVPPPPLWNICESLRCDFSSFPAHCWRKWGSLSVMSRGRCVCV